MGAMGASGAVCITGLQRSFPEIALNVRAALDNLYHPEPLHDAVDLFGVRPAHDAWADVRQHLPPITAESVQQPCRRNKPAWFSAYARTANAYTAYLHNFVQSLCDLAACARLIEPHETAVRSGSRYRTVARLRLDLAWEVPLSMPLRGLGERTVHVSRMNAKRGINDKWAIGLREPMMAYLSRVEELTVATRLHNSSKRASGLALGWLHRHSSAGPSMYDFACNFGAVNEGFRCTPVFDRHTVWQGARTSHRFTLTSEQYLHWALWRRNVSIGYEPRWMFCKFGDATNGTSRKCVPRMRRRTPCKSLVCQASNTDCACANQACVTYDERLRKNVTRWYCQDVEGRQLAFDGSIIRGS